MSDTDQPYKSEIEESLKEEIDIEEGKPTETNRQLITSFLLTKFQQQELEITLNAIQNHLIGIKYIRNHSERELIDLGIAGGAASELKDYYGSEQPKVEGVVKVIYGRTHRDFKPGCRWIDISHSFNLKNGSLSIDKKNIVREVEPYQVGVYFLVDTTNIDDLEAKIENHIRNIHNLPWHKRYIATILSVFYKVIKKMKSIVRTIWSIILMVIGGIFTLLSARKDNSMSSKVNND